LLAVGTSLSYYIGGGHFWPKPTDPARRRPARLRDGLKAATSTSNQTRSSDASDPCRPRQEAGRRQADGGGDPLERARASHRDRAGGLDALRRRARFLDPRAVVEAVDAIVPRIGMSSSAAGHQAYFPAQMRAGRRALYDRP